MADDLSNFPIMSDPGVDIGDTFADYDPSGAAAIDNYSDAFSWGSIWDAITSPTAKNLLNIGSGLYGLYESGQQRNLAKDAIKASDPFGPYRQQYAQQLMALMADPTSITKDPGYQFQLDQGNQAVERFMASKGFLGSGNEGIALEKYGQDYASKYLNDKITQLAGLAGANISPNPGPGLNAYNQGLDTASASLASLGYGLTRAGASAGTPAAQHPKTAGGEAATVGSDIKTVGSIVSAGSKLAGIAGFDSSAGAATGQTLGDVGNIVTGVSQGGIGGYGKAAAGVADLAGVDTAGWGGIISAGANVAEGNYAGAGMDLAGVALGSPIVAVGNLAAAYLNKAFLGDASKDRNVNAFRQATGASEVNLTLGKYGMTYWNVNGKLYDAKTFNDLAGSWYGATFAPDGNREEWQQKYQDFSANAKEAQLPKGYVWNGSQIVRG